jgi:hypothetical protein
MTRNEHTPVPLLSYVSDIYVHLYVCRLLHVVYPAWTLPTQGYCIAAGMGSPETTVGAQLLTHEPIEVANR